MYHAALCGEVKRILSVVIRMQKCGKSTEINSIDDEFIEKIKEWYHLFHIN